ncbi:TM0106 family RecB-like putative nuclease [Paeniglutamicibacter cryotolerans]|uniref:Uncharacterized protein n=1 Tax=Paeniglutamicibacter cryotolerans TaxID=670079 RepID=A0A839QQL0_9MICC|nr:bifunctional RecB family nuclease/DEAD/DEAH box helicase [Paeniglutamicibacter cryotolerans]MBB2995542.1 uncharacterized protein [Paeniglutamicibacter cryotolerans]
MFLLASDIAGAPADLVFSASDLVTASECEYRSLRVLDLRLGRTGKPDFGTDEMLDRAAALGDVHENKVLHGLINQFGPWDRATGTGVKQLARADSNRTALSAARDETLEALRIGADVVFQATFFDGEFVGFADFLVREPDGAYSVWDSKLARHAKVTALLQLAAYGDQLLASGIPLHSETRLVLGDNTHSVHEIHDLLPVFRDRRDRFRSMSAAARAGNAVTWGQPGIGACGRCDYCFEQVTAHRDLLLVAGMSSSRRKKLMDAGITTIDELAAMPATAATGAVSKLRDQARMQTGVQEPDGSRTFTANGTERTVGYRLLPTQTISRLPAPSPGDIYFDFEGDPLWQDTNEGWGLEYLFGVIEVDTGSAVFKPFWAHSRAGERQAFLDFLAYVEDRRKTWPELHVYHYAAYEKSALRNLSLRHVAGEETVDDWLREGLLVDLYETVRNSLRITEASYSIKKIEPLYMGENLRSGDVKDAGASVVAYSKYTEARDGGDAAVAATILTSISDYNEYDCLSTLELDRWLRSLAPATAWESHAQQALPDSAAQAPVPEPSPEEIRLRDYLAALPDDRDATPEEAAIAMVAAATGYHRREDKQYWWDLFSNIDALDEDLAETRNSFLVHRATVLEDWAKVGGARTRMKTRFVELIGTAPEGSDFREGSKWHRVMSGPAPETYMFPVSTETGRYAAPDAEVESIEPAHDALGKAARDETMSRIVLREKETGKLPADGELPIRLLVNKPVNTASLRAALAALAQEVGATVPDLPAHPGLDILRRRSPQLATLNGLPALETDEHGRHNYIKAITAAVSDLDHSYLAVQGPPGTGKTHVGSHVIAELVGRGWNVGVVGQSHAVVENMLRAAINKAGVDPDLVGKKVRDGIDPDSVPWRVKTDEGLSGLLGSGNGALIGGTAWTMTGNHVGADSLDLLVIDEAGQYSLANTLAVARSAKRLLLLGDPQQLPQVTQGQHPEPVDESALGWLSAGHSTLPEPMGYFLADSWRMHPRLCAAVSKLSYRGKLESTPAASARHLEGAEPGVHTVMVSHQGNSTSSVEEAAEVINQIHAHLGLPWHDPREGGGSRPLEASDILVVAAYNAQVNIVRDALDAAGLGEARVGTVDKFQGQEAPVVLMSMACSAAVDAPRGMEFLLNRNRVNVAVSRGQWRAVIIRSPELTNYMPSNPAVFAELGAFIGLDRS